MSLAHLLNSQADSSIGHEQMPIHWWPIAGDFPKARDILLEKAKDHAFVGNVSYCWMQYVPDIISSFPNAKFIYIWRDKEEVVESFWLRNQDRRDSDLIQPQLWLSQYPFLRYPPTKDAISDTYDMYEAMAHVLTFKYPGRIYYINIGSLNEDENIHKLLSFVGVPRETQVIEKTKMNVGGQAPIKFTRIRNVPSR